MIRNKDKRGFTLIELLVAMGIFTLIIIVVTNLLIYAIRLNAIIWNQLVSQADGRKVVREIVDNTRKSVPSSIGGYPIASASSTEFIFYANVDADNFLERLRYTLTSSTVERGITKPSGNPLQYAANTEQVVTLAHYVRNTTDHISLFTYFGEGYASSTIPLPAPVTTTLIRVVEVNLELEKDPNQSPAPLFVRGSASIRNLKTN